MQPHTRRGTGLAELERAGAQIDLEVDRRGEALTPVLAEKVVVGGRQEPVTGEGGDDAVEGTREEQCPGPRLDTLARDVDDDQIELVVRRAPRHDEVARERG